MLVIVLVPTGFAFQHSIALSSCIFAELNDFCALELLVGWIPNNNYLVVGEFPTMIVSSALLISLEPLTVVS